VRDGDASGAPSSARNDRKAPAD